MLLIDIAVPRDIDPDAKFLENVYLYNIDDLQEIAGDCLRQRQDEIARCQALIREKTRALMEPAARVRARPQIGRRQHLTEHPMPAMRPILIATRGSALARAQSGTVLASCREKFPGLAFELVILKTTGDRLQAAGPAPDASKLPRALFTKELEDALLDGRAEPCRA